MYIVQVTELHLAYVTTQTTVRVPHDTTVDTPFTVYSADYDSKTSVSAFATILGTLTHEVWCGVAYCLIAGISKEWLDRTHP